MARWRKLGLIAGAGPLPARLAAHCRERGEPFFVVRLAGVADAAMAAFEGEAIGIAEAGRIIRVLKEQGCDAVALAGVVRRPDFRSLKPDWRGAALIPRLVAAAARGDGALLGVLVETLEGEGFIVAGADEVAGGLAAPAGALGRIAPSPEHLADIRKGAAIVRALGPFDVGQGAVVANGLVLAIEAAEGTDAMLERVARLPAALRGGETGGVLVKALKPGQERRVDLPTIGVETVAGAHRAGLGGVAVEAGSALIIDAQETARAADALGLFVFGFQGDARTR